MAYHSKYSGAEVDALLDKIKDDNVGSIDSSLSTTSDNPVKNKVITEELNKKANKTDIATVNGQPLTNGGNIEVITDAYDDTEIKGKLTDLDSQIGAEATARTNVDAELQTQINSKQEALTLTVKDNGNIVLANIQGQSKEFMPATPSGDPMHYAYVAAGAEYNDTGADIVKTTPWADLADDDADKTVVHKAGYWYVNGLGDISNDDMRVIFLETNNFLRNVSGNAEALYYGIFSRVNLPMATYLVTTSRLRTSYYDAFRSTKLEVVSIPEYPNSATPSAIYCFRPTYTHNMYNSCTRLKFISGLMNLTDCTTTTGMFLGCKVLKTVKLYGIKLNIDISASPALTIKSILYMIQNEAATSAKTITLHPDAYARAMANADILVALEQHTNISLASA